MKTTRKNFTSGLKYCKRNEQKIKDTLVAESFRNENVSKFWKEVHSRTKLNKRCSDEIDGLKCYVLLVYLHRNLKLFLEGQMWLEIGRCTLVPSNSSM